MKLHAEQTNFCSLYGSLINSDKTNQKKIYFNSYLVRVPTESEINIKTYVLN